MQNNRAFKNNNIIVVLFLATIAVLIVAAGEHFDVLVHISFLMIVFQSVYFMTVMQSPIVKVYFVFSYLFFGCIPYLEHSNAIFAYWGLPNVPSDLLFLINIFILLLNLMVVAAYCYSGRKSFKSIQRFYLDSDVLYFMSNGSSKFKYKDRYAFLVILALGSTLLVLYINNFNLANLFYRDAVFERVSVGGPLSMIINYFVKPIPAIVLIYYLSYKPEHYKYKSIVFIFLCLINVFPTGVPRFYAAAIYIPILILFFNSLLTKGRLSYLIILSIFFVFPVLNSFRRVSSAENFSFFKGFDFLYHGHFDSYLSIGQVIQHDFISYGRQLLGSVFFFVPRGLWPGKPTGTGHTLLSNINAPFTNISANYYAEGYANFGYLGMFLFALVMGFTLRQLDERFMRKLTLGKGSDETVPMYLVSLGFLFFIMRGDLLSSLSFFIGFYLCAKLCSIFFKRVRIA